MFQKAVRKKSFLRLGLTGPSGSGKTYSSLLLAKGLGGRVACIDTENGSASLYAHLHDFDCMNLAPPYRPERFIEAINAAVAAKYNVLIIDSLSHEWNGQGGILELVDDLAKSKFRGNSWSAWSEATPRHRALLDAILRAPLHVIVTLRSKTETAQQDDGTGRKKVVKLGMRPESRDGVEYEFGTILEISHGDGHFAIASKDRTGLFSDKDPERITEATGRKLLDWLNSGAGLTPEPEVAKPAYASKEQLERLGKAIAVAIESGAHESREACGNWLRDHFKITSAKDLTVDQAEEAIKILTVEPSKDV